MKKWIKLYCYLIIFNLLNACSGHSDNPTASNPNILQGLPPDPGVAGKATLKGIDSDNDGVRDDLQRYIAIQYQNSDKTRHALSDMAKADQEFLLNAMNKDRVIEAVKKQSKASSCNWYLDPEKAYQESKKLRAEILNTEERIKAWIKADSHLGGMTFSVPLPEEWKAMCTFDPDKLKN